MKRIKRYFEKRQLKQKLKKLKSQKIAILSLVHDGTLKLKDPLLLKWYNENKVETVEVISKLSNYETR